MTGLQTLMTHLEHLPALLEAVQRGDLEAARAAVRAGAQPAPMAICAAAESGSPDVLRFLLESGGEATAHDEKGSGAIHHAAIAGHTDIVRLLLEAGAGANQAGPMGVTPLHAALSHREGDTSDRSEMVRLLLNTGADPNVLTENGLSPLELALMRTGLPGVLEILRLLAAAGAKLNVQNELGQTPLHRAATKGEAEIVAILLDAGADVSVRDKYGQTPAQAAESAANPYGRSKQQLQGDARYERQLAVAATIRAREKHGFLGFGRR